MKIQINKDKNKRDEIAEMRIGITYDLKEDYLREGYTEEEACEFDSLETIEALQYTLQDLGYKTDPVGNVKTLSQRLAKGDRWDLVFNIAEGLRGFGREAQVPCLLDAYNIPYTFSDPLILSLSLHKGMAKRVFRDLGIPTPAFSIVEKEADAEKIDLPFPLFTKPIAEGTSKGITASSKIHCQRDLISVCKNLLEKYQQPVLVEIFLPGREFTVGIIGTGQKARSLGVLEINLREKAKGKVYSYFNKQNYKESVEYSLAHDDMAKWAAHLALRTWRNLGCQDAGRVDLRADEQNNLYVLEINPLAGLHPKNSDLPILCSLKGISYHELIRMIMDSAKEKFFCPQKDPCLKKGCQGENYGFSLRAV